MLKIFIAALTIVPGVAVAQNISPGRWNVTSTVVEMQVPGMPGFLQRMARGKSKAEHKLVPPGQEVEALLAPDPKANCRVDSQRVVDGHYAQALTCPQKNGQPMRIARVGTYGSTGFVGRATVAEMTPKGRLSIVLDQRAVRVGG